MFFRVAPLDIRCVVRSGRRLAARIAIGGLTIGTVLAAERGRTTALPPEEARAGLQVAAGLRVDLVAAEPLVVSPVAFAFDERGRLFVVEGRGYPGPADPKVPPTNEGRIALLEDTDGDGRYDRRTEFAQGLTHPNGLALWRGGVFVTCAPDILYLKDHDGDGVADERRVVLTGFDTSRSPQLRVSSPVLGLDGKFYVAGGLTGGKVTSPAHPERAAVTFAPADGRFDPESLVYEVTGGRGQFGLTFDAFGRRFISSNRHPLLQVVLEPWHLARNPHLGFTATTQEVSLVESEARVWPVSGAAVTADFIPSLINTPHTGTFTSACGGLIFSGAGWPAGYQDNAFICEPAQNLVQRQVLAPMGATFQARPATPGREFLASADSWFRPVFLADGPDGALYVADMHRREIDHPAYVPADVRGTFDFESGKAHGRLYRVAAAGARRMRAWPTEPAAWLDELGSPEAWRRDTAFRLLLERGAAVSTTALEATAAAATEPAARLRGWALLRAQGTLTPARLLRALGDPHPAVREGVLGLASTEVLADPAVLATVGRLATDADARVRLATALAFGPVREERVAAALADIAVRADDDRWGRIAALSGVAGRVEIVAAAVRRQAGEFPRGVQAVEQDLGRLLGAGGTPAAVRDFLAPVLAGDGGFARRAAVVLGVAEGWRARAGAEAPPWADVGEPWRLLAAEAGRVARDGAAMTTERVTAIALLGAFGPVVGGALPAELLEARQPLDVQLAVVRAGERRGDASAGALLVNAKIWPGYSPQVRAAVLAAMTATPTMLGELLTALERGTLAPADIAPAKRTQLQKHANATIRARAEAIFRRIEAGDRMQVYQAHREVLALPADAETGRAVFLRVCATCHTRGGVGGNVGPDLTGIRNQPAEAILLHTLVPNFEVAPAFQAMTVETRDGRTVTGWIAAETEHAVTLRTAAGSEEVVLRANVAALTAAGGSLMPDGLEQAMTRAELAALMAFLKSPP